MRYLIKLAKTDPTMEAEADDFAVDDQGYLNIIRDGRRIAVYSPMAWDWVGRVAEVNQPEQGDIERPTTLGSEAIAALIADELKRHDRVVADRITRYGRLALSDG
jgi:hypothetical protein